MAAIAGTVLMVGLLTSMLVGLFGLTPGKALVGIRVLSAEDARPIGVLRAMLRTLLLGVATLPTLGFGAAALAWTAMVDPSGWRRGWHDLRTGSVVVDVRPVPERRGARGGGAAPGRQPHRDAAGPGLADAAPADPDPGQAAARATARGRRTAGPPTVTPRQGLGWPLVGEAPADAAPAPSEAPARGPRPTAAAGTSAGRPHPAAPADAAAPPVRWQVTFDTGEQFEVRGLTLVGRRPEPRPGEPVKRLVTLPSDDMSLSKTHAQFQVVPDGALVVMDRGSTNGSILIRAGVTKRLVGGKPATLRDGDRVRFGDREMTVARP